MRYLEDGLAFLIIWFVFIIGIIILGITPAINSTFGREIETVATVTDKQVKPVGGNGKYLIFAENESGEPEVFEITDSWIRLKFNSSDMFAVIKVGETYRFVTRGRRLRVFSWYPNIYAIDKL